MTRFYNDPYKRQKYYPVKVAVGDKTQIIEILARNKTIARMVAEFDGYTVVSVGTGSDHTTIPETINI